MVNYVVANYLGGRRFYPNIADPLFYVRKQCEFFQNHNVADLGKVTFVLNKCNIGDRDNLFIDYVNGVKLNVEHELIVRENIGFSYGAWQEVVMKNSNYDYHFLIEDDYLPTDELFLEPFLELLDDNTIYVCQLYWQTPKPVYLKPRRRRHLEVNPHGDHCAISNGLLNSKIILKEKIRIADKTPLNIGYELSDSYVQGCSNQVVFLKNFVNIGYEIKDITDDYSVPFAHLNTIVQYGNPDGKKIIIPIS